MTGNTAFDSAASQEIVSHFWACSYPSIKTSLFVVRQPGCLAAEPVKIFLYDPDGAPINEAGFDFPADRAGVLELEGLLESCKLEGGFKHAHLEARFPQGVKCYLRMYTREGAFIQGEPSLVNSRKGAFVPVLFSQNHSGLLVFVNHGRSDMTVRCRLFCGRRNPEMTQLVPALGARVMSIPANFSEFSMREGAAPIQGYFRITAVGDGDCGVQLIESVVVRENEEGIFGSIS